ncbi:hypothetical protein CPU12_01915 [Malaciobacter molluscorum LMG 25693]|uniref:Membrane protein n=1 Tax=Malaciobacter molluscorum LMG 25693 TaxID=870501 RepID=A0A2G1DKK7_9BACT|nr:hypothetical protein [Malaciobacter molluscorum]AXX92602.1 putative membrane protein [Malaciobacter molluscorum LMG 25693]PHO19027.1 hypothetical protein CPU12_01915 [Malaciobacter molluscorum LMG 25693]
MFIEALEYIGIIAIVLTVIVSYNQYMAGKFSKDYNEVEDKTKKQSKLKKWWDQSYIREIYRVRASQRKLICFIPWLGVWISLFFVYWFGSSIFYSLLHPPQPLEKLKKYEGVITKAINYKKGDDRVDIKLEDGTIKIFHAHITGINLKERYIGKEVVVLAKNEWGILDFGSYELIVWMEMNFEPIDTIFKTYDDKYTYEFTIVSESWLPNLILSLKWLIGSLALLWFINRKPVVTKNEIDKNAYLFEQR